MNEIFYTKIIHRKKITMAEVIGNRQPLKNIRIKQRNSSFAVSLVLFAISFFGVSAFAYMNTTAGSAVVALLFIFFVSGLCWSSILTYELAKDSAADFNATFLRAFIVRIIFAVILYYFLVYFEGAPYLGGGDDQHYYENGLDAPRWFIVSGYGRGSIVSNLLRPDNEIYFYIIYVISLFGIKMGGVDQLLPILLNCFVGAMVPVYVSLLGNKFQLGKKGVQIATNLAIWSPDFILYSSVVLRDVFIVLSFLVALYHFFKLLYVGFSLKDLLVFSFLFFWFIPGLRRQMFLLLLLIIPIIWLISNWRAPKRFSRLVTIILIGVTLFAGLSLYEISDLQSAVQVNAVAQQYGELGREGAAQSSLGASILNLPSFLSAPLFGILNFITPFPPGAQFLFAPSVKSFVEALGGIFQYILLPYYIIGIVCLFRKSPIVPNKSIIVAIALLGVFVMFGLGLSSTLSIRLRLVAMPLLYLIAGFGWANRSAYKIIVPIWWAGVASMTVMYMILKVDALYPVVLPAIIVNLLLFIIVFLVSPLLKKLKNT